MRLSLGLYRDDDEPSVADSSLGDHMIAQVANSVHLSVPQRDFRAVLVIQIDVGCRHHQVVVVRACLREPLGEPSHVTVASVDQSPDANLAYRLPLGAELLEAGPTARSQAPVWQRSTWYWTTKIN